MLQWILYAALAPSLVAADAPLSAGTQLNYRGGIEARGEDAGAKRKTFDLTLWILQQSESGAEIFWLVDEGGRGEFPWPQRFGRLSVDARWRTAAPGPAVLYDRGDGASAVPIVLPLFVADKPLAAGVSFDDGKLQTNVDKAAKAAGRQVWQLHARDAFGPKRSLLVDQHSPLVLHMTEKLVMGRGEEYQLQLEWISSEQLAGEPLAALAKASDRLMTLRGKLNLPVQAQEAAWKKEQLELLREQLPQVAETTAATPLKKLVESARRDLQLQSGRSDAVADLGGKFDGRAVEEFSVKGFGDEALSLEDLKGRVTVLHFWEYRDEPLKEPYGQVGYLDFVYHRRKPSGLQVFGVAVDGRLADEKTRGAAERSVKKLKSFMHLSYPVLLDSGALVKQFGDPRLVGAPLPLFVVIGPDGKIIHYHVGHYDVHQDQGLKELDEVVVRALEKK